MSESTEAADAETCRQAGHSGSGNLVGGGLAGQSSVLRDSDQSVQLVSAHAEWLQQRANGLDGGALNRL